MTDEKVSESPRTPALEVAPGVRVEIEVTPDWFRAGKGLADADYWAGVVDVTLAVAEVVTSRGLLAWGLRFEHDVAGQPRVYVTQVMVRGADASTGVDTRAYVGDQAAYRDALNALRRAGAEATDEGRALVASVVKLREALVDYRLKVDVGDAELISRVLDGDSLAEPGGRDIAVNRAASIAVVALPIDASWEAVALLHRPSLVAMGANGSWFSHFETAWRRARDRRVELDALSVREALGEGAS